MCEMTLFQQDLLERIAKAQERLADAEERRNDLLVQDQADRRESWEQERRDQAERWAHLTEGSET